MNQKFLLVLICLLFLLTRLYKINEIPSSVYWDEASIGYNAYSISKDFKDEWGDFLPIHFRAFGEFKLPVYIYSVVPLVKLFGLNEFSVRFPAVLFSLGVVILTYLLAKKLSASSNVGLFAAFFVTISPWFFIFSRTGYEATAGLMFYLFGILLFLHKTGGKFLLFSILSFILSAYSYNSFRIIAPLTILLLVFIERDHLRQLKNSLHWIVLSLFFLALSIWPIYRLYVYDAGASRLQSVGANRSAFVKNYLSHFSPTFLMNGDKNLRSQQLGFGQIYFPDLILIPLGFLYMISSKSKYKFLLLALVLLGPIPASLTRESPHALRAIAIVPFICMLSAMGIVSIKKKIYKVVFILIFLSLFINYFVNFLTVYPKLAAVDWQYEYKKIFTGLNLNSDKRNKIHISDENGQPYIFALFYLKYDPETFRREVVRNNISDWGFSTVRKFGKFEFVKSQELILFKK